METPEIDVQALQVRMAQAQERGETGTTVSIDTLDALLRTAREASLDDAHEVAIEALGMYASTLSARQERVAHISHSVLNFVIGLATPASTAVFEAVHAA